MQRQKLEHALKGNLGAISLVILAVTIIVGTIVFYNIYTVMPTAGMPQAGTNAIANVSVLFSSGIQLLSVGLIIVPAAVILGYVFLIRE